jgi:hypothetical protein
MNNEIVINVDESNSDIMYEYLKKYWTNYWIETKEPTVEMSLPKMRSKSDFFTEEEFEI